MILEKKIALSLRVIHNNLEAKNDIKLALKYINNLADVVGRLGRNEEALYLGSLRGKETLEEAEKENKIILSSDLMLHEIILRK